ncbi:MAG: cytochrome C [Ignavibacteria bacterium CG_4_9_14_0_2_um_filter_37_13]|nr:MAG: cytochrome C [Ignavibacteria bacterium CG_4_9_14_0_2_um_filter_37_13]
MKRKYPDSFYNPTTLVGGALAAVSFSLVLFLMVLEAFEKNPKPYMGIVAFVILPTFLLFGIGLMIFGILNERKRLASGKKTRRLPVIDLNDPAHRFSTIMISFGAILLLIFSAFGSFKVYEYTDSDEFCGTICHSVMAPEYTAYQYSPHAKVGCVQCHIGSGVSWFVKAKISGSYQVYSVLFNKYSRPIPTPIENLRPAQQTCEQCHWPKHFFSEKKLVSTYYLSDEKNSKFTINLLVKIGGGNIEAGPTNGIHWHMNIGNEVTYITTDPAREKIPWVKSKSMDGKEVIYESTEHSLTKEEKSKAEARRMDCIDCHNRPSHIYHDPFTSVNHLMSLNWVDPTLPNIKSVAVDALENPYQTKEAALDSIKLLINQFYQNNYPQLASSKKSQLERAIQEIQKIYSRNYFPEMNVSWKKFPNHIGHMYSPGCFRCHDGKHKSKEGKVLSRDCNVCHTILSQQFERDTLRLSLSGVDYFHPVDVGSAWKEENCSDCHAKK